MSAAPYPADTRAKGWRFELDHERIETSATWALAPTELRPWLLMLWLTAWKQTPCGSLDGDEAVIAARIGMSAKMWAKHRAVLLRGWDAADDGRLYHPTITELVLEMMSRRRSESDRKAAQRAAKASESQGSPANVPRDNHGTAAESDTDHRLPVPEEKTETPADAGPVSRAPNSKNRTRTPGAKPLPAEWEPKATDVQRLAVELRLAPEVVRVNYAESFRDVCSAKGYLYRDHDAAFRNCVRQDWPRLRAVNGSRPSAGNDPFAGAA